MQDLGLAFRFRIQIQANDFDKITLYYVGLQSIMYIASDIAFRVGSKVQIQDLDLTFYSKFICAKSEVTIAVDFGGVLFAKSRKNWAKLELNLKQVKHVFEQQKFTNVTPYRLDALWTMMW